MLASVGLWLGKSALMRSPIGKLLKAIPWQLWAVLGAGLALWLGLRWHAHEVKKTYQSGYDQATKDWNVEQRKLQNTYTTIKTAGDDRMTAATKKIKDTHDAQAAHIDGNLADLFRVYDAANGSARSADDVPGAAGAASAQRDLPPTDDGLAQEAAADHGLIAVPAKQLYVRAGICDRDYIAVIAWQEWYAEYKRTYDEWLEQVKAAKPAR